MQMSTSLIMDNVKKSLANELLKQVGGPDKNDLNNVLQLNSRQDDQKETFASSDYHDIDSFIQLYKSNQQKFTTFSLNIESIQSKFNQLTSLVEILDQNEVQIDALLLQETWLTDLQCKSNIIDLYQIPGYHTISLGRQCGRKGGLIIYLNENFTYSLRYLFTPSLNWEGLFIDITLIKNIPLINKITLSNIYRPPRQNNSNSSIDNFLQPFSTVLKKTKL